MEIQNHDIAARERRPGQYCIQKKQGGRLFTIDDGPYTQAEADRIAIQRSREDDADAFRWRLNNLLELLEGL
jgi:hypothetical protein